MSITKISESSSTSTESFEDAIQRGIARYQDAAERQKRLDQGTAGSHQGQTSVRVQVDMMVTFVVED